MSGSFSSDSEAGSLSGGALSGGASSGADNGAINGSINGSVSKGSVLKCPRCDRPITRTTIRCPNCDLELKAHGHPGMDLHRASNDTPLCATCTYDADDSCNFPKRPHAMTCTLYQSVDAPRELSRKEVYSVPVWRKNTFRLALFIVIIFSLLVLSL